MHMHLLCSCTCIYYAHAHAFTMLMHMHLLCSCTCIYYAHAHAFTMLMHTNSNADIQKLFRYHLETSAALKKGQQFQPLLPQWLMLFVTQSKILWTLSDQRSLRQIWKKDKILSALCHGKRKWQEIQRGFNLEPASRLGLKRAKHWIFPPNGTT